MVTKVPNTPPTAGDKTAAIMREIALGAMAVTAVVLLIRQIMQRRARKLRFPVVPLSNPNDYTEAVMEGYRKYPDQPFILPQNPPLVMLPLSMYMESKSMEAASRQAATHQQFMGRWTGMPSENRPDVLVAIRQDLNKNLPEVLHIVQDETRYAFDKEIGHPEDWRSLALYPTMLRLVSLLSGRVFVGLPLSRSEEWIDASINFTTSLASVMNDSRKYHPWVVPFIAPLLESVRRTRTYMRKGEAWMAPLVAELMAQDRAKQEGKSGDVDLEKKKFTSGVRAGTRGTFIQWMLSYAPAKHRTAKRIGTAQMIISFAAIHTTSMTGSIALLDLLIRPEYIQPLREEIEQVLAEEPEVKDESGMPYIPKSAYAKLRKLDSFIKESQRFHGLGLTTPPVECTEDITFSNGLKVPKGTRLAWATHAIGMDTGNKTLSPEYNAPAGNPGPEVFEGFRFAKLRDLPGNDSKHQSVTTGLDSLTFGHGPHSCPGRFFAIYEVKALFVQLLRHYDMRLTGDGAKMPFIRHGAQLFPNPGAKIEIKNRAA